MNSAIFDVYANILLNIRQKTLVLHDHQLNHNFTMAIGNRALVSMGIPGEFGGTKFEIPMKYRRGGCSRIRIR